MTDLLLPFSKIAEEDFVHVGGKAYTLSRLARAGLPVPEGCVLTRSPDSEEEWQSVFTWWRNAGSPAVAVRSSAIDEDSAEHSFAGQHKTFLNVTDETALRASIPACFESVRDEASVAYRKRFEVSRADDLTGGMGVILQTLVFPRFAGVYFSRDPRGAGNSGHGLLEIVQGFGESLVSGQETPLQLELGLSQELTPLAKAKGWTNELSTAILAAATTTLALLGCEVDIEWAVDQGGKLWILQARPITALPKGARQAGAERRELARLRACNPADALWDGQTFAEWTGSPTPLSFEVWRHAFSRAGALGKALHDLGYAGSSSAELAPRETVLDEVFGRAYVNLSRMERLYFGATPYVTVPKPRPHLAFRMNKLSFRALANCLPGTLKMIATAWRLGTGRKKILADAERALLLFERRHRLPTDPGIYATWDMASLASRWEDLASELSESALVHPLKLMIAIEASQQALLRSLGEEKLGTWLSSRLRLPSLELALLFDRACQDEKLRPMFLAQYGHRGPGEFNLAEPRWAEHGQEAFRNPPRASAAEAQRKQEPTAAPTELNGVFARMAEEEWELFSAMLVLREHWKDSLMRPYAHLRWIALELGRKLGWENDIFWLRPIELRELVASPGTRGPGLRRLASRRRERQSLLKQVSLPLVFGLSDLTAVPGTSKHVESGEAVSSGLAYGEIRLVTDPSRVCWETWPENAVLVAEATDPGWTPIFSRARAVITERGGALSHCAIVAREMGLPAVSGVTGCMKKFKEGENVWVDGTHGHVTRA